MGSDDGAIIAAHECITAWRDENPVSVARLSGFAYRSLIHHVAAVLAALRATLARVEGERDEATKKWREILVAEHALSESYVRLRAILDALDPPVGWGGMEAHELWAWVEEKARALCEALASRTAERERLREALAWAVEQIGNDRHARTCGVLGQPLCRAHAALALFTPTQGDPT